MEKIKEVHTVMAQQKIKKKIMEEKLQINMYFLLISTTHYTFIYNNI